MTSLRSVFASLFRRYRAAFGGLPREVWLLAAATLVNRAGTMVQPFLALYLTERLGLAPTTAGTILMLYGVGSLSGAGLGGWLADRFGALQVMMASLVGTGVGFLVLMTARDATSLAIVVPLVAIVAEAFRPALLASVTSYAEPGARTRSLALVRLAINLGMSVGPAVGGLLAAWRYEALFVVDALTCLAAALALWRWLGSCTRTRLSSTRASAARSPLADGPFLCFLLLVFLLAVAFFQLLGAWPVHLRRHYELSAAAIGALLAMNALLIALCEMVVVDAASKRQPLAVMAVGSLLVCLGFGVLPLGTSLGFAMLSGLIWTAGEMLSLPFANAVAAARAPTGSEGRYMGAYSVAFGAAVAVAPALGLWIFAKWGPTWLWSGVALLGVGLLIGFSALAPWLDRTNPVDRGLPPAGATS